jgi:hypothetical protein
MHNNKYKNYKFFMNNFKEKDTSVITNIFSIHFINRKCIGLYDYITNKNRIYRCPYCLEQLSEYEYDSNPIYTYGCYMCADRRN